MREKRILSTILYLTALALWLSVALVKYTFFKDILPMSQISHIFFRIVMILLLGKWLIDFRFCARQIVGLFLLILFMTIARASATNQFAVMFALIYCANNVPFDKILKVSLVMQTGVFLTTVIASQVGILEDYIWEPAVRNRHGLGFTHCMLASHFGLYIAMVYVAIRKKITLIEVIAVLAFNYVIYYFTDGRTDMYLSVLFVILAYFFGNLKMRLKGEKILALASTAIPFVLCVFSIVITLSYDPQNATFVKLNYILNNRLILGNYALQEHGFPLFGKEVEWVGASTLYYYPDRAYNYVDNSYISMLITYGVVWIATYCATMSWLLYKLFLKKETMLITCVLITLAFGLINPQSMYLTYNPFLLLLAGIWSVDEERDVYDGRQFRDKTISYLSH